MNALVTGGAGFIGSNVVRSLVEHGHSVVVLDNLSTGHRCNLDPFPDVRLLVGDVRDESMVQRAIRGAEVVFHLAASVGNARSIADPIGDSEINVIGMLRILESARQEGVRKIILSSSAGIFGELKYLPIREDHPAEPNSPYGTSKLAAEKHSLAYGKLYDMEVIALRYFNVYGINQRYDAYGNVIPIFARRILRGEPLTIFGDGEQTRDFVNVRDVATANYQAALARGLSGAFNIASGTQVTINCLADLMSDVSGIYVERQYGEARKGDVRHSLADISAAAQALGYHPAITLRDGLAEYMDWARREFD